MNVTKLRFLAAAAVIAASLGSSSAWAARIYVNVAPPAPIVDVRPPVPGPGYVWVSGYHRWDGGSYVWVPGRWDTPPRRHARWVEGRWRHHGHHGYYWEEGRWR